MTVQFNTVPTYTQTLNEGKSTSRAWYRWFQGIAAGTPTGAESTIEATESPMTYKAPSAGSVIVQGGTVAMIQFSRTSGVNYNTGQTQGMFPVSAGDRLVITYSAAPALTFVPQ